jgi:hypothetical protein
MERELARILEHLEDLKAVGEGLGREGAHLVEELQWAGSHIEAAKQAAKKAKRGQHMQSSHSTEMARLPLRVHQRCT